MKSRVVPVRLKEDFYQALKDKRPEGVSTYIRQLVEKEAFRSHTRGFAKARHYVEKLQAEETPETIQVTLTAPAEPGLPEPVSVQVNGG